MSQQFHHIKAIIMDLDGTMVDTAPDFLVAVNRMLQTLSFAPITLAQVKQFVGKGTENLLNKVLGLYVSETDIATYYVKALPVYMQHYAIINGQFSTLFPEVKAGLQAFKDKGLHLACVTNKPAIFAQSLLKQTGLDVYFEVVYGGDSLAKKKPDPLPMQTVFKDFSVLPEEVVAIGDSSNDALAARAAGCYVLTVPYGYNHGKSVQEINSDGIVSTLLDAARLIV